MGSRRGEGEALLPGDSNDRIINLADSAPVITDDDKVYDLKEDKHNATLFGSYANLTTGIIGVGILSFPYAFLQAGIFINLAFTIAFAFVNIYSIYLMAMFAERLIMQGKLKHATYEVVVTRILGKKAYYLVTVCILFTVLGTLTAFFIVAADLGQPVLEEWVHVDGAFGDFLTSRTIVVLFFAIFFAFPLAMLPNMHHLSWTSIIAVGSIFMVAGVVIYRGCEALSEDARSLTNNVSLAQGSLRIILALPLCVFALGCQLQVVPVYAELKKEKRKEFGIVVWSSVFSCAILYIIVGMIGYLEFGPNTKGDILSNYSVSDIPVDIAKLVMGFHLVLAYPIALFPGRKCLDFFLVTILPLDRVPLLLRVALESIVMITITGIFAVLLPQVQIVFGLIGSTVSVALGMFFPAAMLWVLPSFDAKTAYETDDGERQDSGDGLKLAKGIYNGSRDFEEKKDGGLLGRLHLSADRIKAILLFGLGIPLVIAGTGVSIYQEFIE